MKHLFSLIAGVILIFSFQNHALCADNYKFGVVDIEKFQEESKSFQKIREGLKQKYESLQEKLEEKKAELGRVLLVYSETYIKTFHLPQKRRGRGPGKE